MKTPTSASADGARQRGVTLFEMLIALALIALAISAGAAGISRISPWVAIDAAAAQLTSDLKRARLETALGGGEVIILFTDGGYEIRAFGMERTWPDGVRVMIEGARKNEIRFGDASRLDASVILLSKGNMHERIEIAPVTRRLSRARD